MRLRRTPRRGVVQLKYRFKSRGLVSNLWKCVVLAVVAVLLAACSTFGRNAPIAWSDLPGWNEASLSSAWPAFIGSCRKLITTDEGWKKICADANALSPIDEGSVRRFFESRFEPHLQRAGWFRSSGLITGYYEPLLNGNWTRTERYRYPVYRLPDDLLTIDLGALYPELKNKRVRGRLIGRRVVPYFAREEIDSSPSPLAGNELLWVDDPVELFFLQIQGSGRVRFPSGEILPIGYADQNGHPYTGLGRVLAERSGLSIEQVDAPMIRAWFSEHSQEALAMMNRNASYVFFALRDPSLPGPIGSLGVPLLAERAIAVDPAYIPLGLPVWLDTQLSDDDKPYRQLVFAQDTGGAIKGPVRADLFLGYGPRAEAIAGRLRATGHLYLLLPRT